MFWGWLSDDESGGTTIRNVGLVIGGVIAILLAVWRGIVAEQSLLDARYQKSAETLGSDLLSVRLGGIYALQRLAEDHSEQYRIQFMGLFCDICTPSLGAGKHRRCAEGFWERDGACRCASRSGSKGTSGYAGHNDGDPALRSGEIVFCLEMAEGNRLDVRRVSTFAVLLSGEPSCSPADITRARLSGVDFAEADLSGSNGHTRRSVMFDRFQGGP